MKRPMCILAVSWLAGLLLASRETIGTTPVLMTYFFLIILGLVVVQKFPNVLNSRVQSEWYPKLTLLLLLIPCLFLAGFFRMEQRKITQAEQELPWKYFEEEGETYVTVEGTVKEKRCEEQVILELTDCVIIGYYGQEDQTAGDCRILLSEEGKEWLPESFIGNKIRVFGTFSTFQPASNPGQFDAYEYYSSKDLYASVKALRITILDEEKAPFGHAMFTLKQRMRESLTQLYPEEKAGVLAAMMLGDKDLLSEEVKELYQQNGISHILAISGLHISLLCMGLFGFLRKLTMPPKGAAAVAVGFLIFYIVFTGASTSSLRAGVMCLILFGAKLLRRSYDLLSSLALAAIVVTAIRPQELTSAGFLLSFGAVLGVALAKEVEWYLKVAAWWNSLLFGALLQCVTLPISVWFYYEISPYSILLNLVVIPLVSLILGGGLVSAVCGMKTLSVARIPAGGTYLLLDFYEWLGGITQKLPFSFVLVGRPEVWQLVLYYAVLLVALRVLVVRAERVRILVLGMVLAASVLFLPGRSSAEILFLDVSQGDGILITTEDGTVILSDCGSSDVSKVGEYRLSPVLKQNGTLLIDMAVVSHLDSDHTSGIKELLENMPAYEGRLKFAAGYQGVIGIVELVLPKVQKKSEAYLALEALAKEKNVTVRYMQAGELLYQEADLLIECLSPDNAKESDNDTSLVFLMQTPELLLWLMGDAETGSEKDIIKHLESVDMESLRDGRLVLLKVGHHGSKTSSGEEFITFLQPDIAIISCGYQNTYGHPHASVLERLEKAESEVFRTDLQGAISVEFGKKDEVRVESWLKTQRK